MMTKGEGSQKFQKNDDVFYEWPLTYHATEKLQSVWNIDIDQVNYKFSIVFITKFWYWKWPHTSLGFNITAGREIIPHKVFWTNLKIAWRVKFVFVWIRCRYVKNGL